MANHPSAERRNRQRIRRTARNKSVKSAVRTDLRKARELVAANKLDDASKAAAKLVSTVDKAAQKGIVHPKAASRIKARLAKRLHAAKKAAG
ncbi:MAG TPA: 30S ribosomal protein S20 [Polyangiaceae bacterium]|nr:30S ribosomal protein S20 [Polyangiaceae bacterium]